MAEAAGWTAHRAEARGPGVLLATKLNVPTLRPGFVPRPRLLGRLDEEVARELTWVCAPAGFGKTAMLADWAHRGARLIAWLPEGLHLVLASRADPLLPTARWRARGQLAQVRTADLRFTAAEAATLLREAVGSELPEDAVAALGVAHRGVGGRLAAGRPLAAAPVGCGRVGGVVLRQSPLRPGLSDRGGAEAAAGVGTRVPVGDLGAGSAVRRVVRRGHRAGRWQRMLEAIERANLFLVPLDEVRGCWRYHHLFADLLRARL